MKILEINNLSKGFFSKKALNGINLDIEEGKIYGILGPNGSGKTTLMRTVAGLIKPTSGEVKVKGYPIGVKTKGIVAFMSTENYLYEFMKIAQIKKYFSDMYKDFNSDKFDSIVKYMKLNKEDKVAVLSTGMKGRLKVALTLSRKAKLYMLDEPLNGIDPISREKILECIVREMSADSTMLISSHLVSEIEKILDEVIFIKEGNIALTGKVEQFRYEQQKSVKDLYKEVFRGC